jgi:hypothetical protein
MITTGTFPVASANMVSEIVPLLINVSCKLSLGVASRAFMASCFSLVFFKSIIIKVVHGFFVLVSTSVHKCP